MLPCKNFCLQVGYMKNSGTPFWKKCSELMGRLGGRSQNVRTGNHLLWERNQKLNVCPEEWRPVGDKAIFTFSKWHHEKENWLALHIWLYSEDITINPRKSVLAQLRKNLAMISVGQHRKAISRISSRWPSWGPSSMALSLSPHDLQQQKDCISEHWVPPFPLSSFPRCSWGSEEEGEALDSWKRRWCYG